MMLFPGLREQKDNVAVSEINRTRSPPFEKCPMVRFYIFPLKVLPQPFVLYGILSIFFELVQYRIHISVPHCAQRIKKQEE
jgi:hypothetical protein